MFCFVSEIVAIGGDNKQRAITDFYRMNAELFIYLFHHVSIEHSRRISRWDPSIQLIVKSYAIYSWWARIYAENVSEIFMLNASRSPQTRFSFHWNNKFFRFSFLPIRIMSLHSPFKIAFVSMRSSAEFCFPFISLSLPLALLLSPCVDQWLYWKPADSLHVHICYVQTVKPTEFTAGSIVDLAKYWLWLRSRATIAHTGEMWRKKNGIAVN